MYRHTQFLRSRADYILLDGDAGYKALSYDSGQVDQLIQYWYLTDSHDTLQMHIHCVSISSPFLPRCM